VAPLGVIVSRLVQDTQERLIYRAQYQIRVSGGWWRGPHVVRPTPSTLAVGSL
jgi:hypothetical protein